MENFRFKMETPAAVIEKLWKEYTADLNQSNVGHEWYAKIIDNYGGKNRKYHNLNHLETKLQHYLSIQQKIKNKTAFVLALYFQ